MSKGMRILKVLLTESVTFEKDFTAPQAADKLPIKAMLHARSAQGQNGPTAKETSHQLARSIRAPSLNLTLEIVTIQSTLACTGIADTSHNTTIQAEYLCPSRDSADISTPFSPFKREALAVLQQ